MENVFWIGYSNEERHSAISKIQSIISKYGDVVDFKIFSDISLSIKIEIDHLPSTSHDKEVDFIPPPVFSKSNKELSGNSTLHHYLKHCGCSVELFTWWGDYMQSKCSSS